MESPIELVRRFCAAWSDNVGGVELAAFFTGDAWAVPILRTSGYDRVPVVMG